VNTTSSFNNTAGFVNFASNTSPGGNAQAGTSIAASATMNFNSSGAPTP
jgi:hypothetical protein